ncbi:MAG: N-acetylmuramoyl-L-alanine amidase [Ktedonobacteraceae bacterium]
MPNVDEHGALPMFVDESRVFIDDNNHTWVVIHKTASGGTAQDIAHFFANDPAKASTHYIVGQDGTIVQCVQEKDGAGGNCCEKGNFAPFLPIGQNLNTWTVSIEHVDPASDNSTPLTDAQKAASFRLVRDICQRHNIPMRRGDATGGIIGHADIDPVDRARCPGNYPWEELFNFLGGNTMPIPNGWRDDPNTLTLVAPNTIAVVLGFRQHILESASWDAGNQPCEVEYHTSQVLLHNASIGAGQVQVFRDGMLWYTPKDGVIQEPYLGLEIDAAYKLITAQQAEIATLKATQPTPTPTPPIDTTALVAAINAIGDGVAPLVASALVEVKKL